MTFYTPKKTVFQKIGDWWNNLPQPNLPDFRPNFGGYGTYKPPASLSNVPAFRPNIGSGSEIPLYHQVSENDASMSAVADKYGVPLDGLVTTNGGTKSLPPKGSFVALPQPDLGYDPAMRGRSYGTYMASPTNAMQGTINYSGNLNEAKAAINQQVQAGQMPQVVSFYTPIVNPTTGQPVSDQEMIANGYTYNNQLKQWELSGAPQLGNNGYTSNNNAGTNSALYLIQHGRYAHNKQNRYTETLKHAKVRWKKQKHGGPANQQVTGTPGQTTETANTVLALHLGSG